MPTKRFIVPCMALVLLFSLQAPGLTIWGTTDKVPAATLLVPFFEVGIDIGTNPHDALPVVFNGGVGPAIIHWEVWGVDGDATTLLFGNETIPQGGSWSGSFRNLINLFRPRRTVPCSIRVTAFTAAS